MPLLLSGEKEAEDVSGPGGRRKSLKRLETAKEIQGKPSHCLGLPLHGLGPAWLNLVRLGPASRTFLAPSREGWMAGPRPSRGHASSAMTMDGRYELMTEGWAGRWKARLFRGLSGRGIQG